MLLFIGKKKCLSTSNNTYIYKVNNNIEYQKVNQGNKIIYIYDYDN